jgi:hypothetical protein
MTKRQLIDEILTLNQTAEPAFLARFEDAELSQYLQHLQVLQTPRLSGNAKRYEKYFVGMSRPAATPPADFGLDSSPVSTEADAVERAALLAKEPPPEAPAEEVINLLPADETEESPTSAVQIAEAEIPSASIAESRTAGDETTDVEAADSEAGDAEAITATIADARIDAEALADADPAEPAEAPDVTDAESTESDDPVSETSEAAPADAPALADASPASAARPPAAFTVRPVRAWRQVTPVENDDSSSPAAAIAAVHPNASPAGAADAEPEAWLF